MSMKKFLARNSKKQIDKVNPELFNRRIGQSIGEYILNGYKAMEAFPHIKILNAEIIRDESEIDVKINRRHLKNKKLKKDKTITKLRSINDTAYEMLKFDVLIEYNSEVRYIKNKKLLLPAYIDDYHFMIEGNEVLLINQLVDSTTYNQGDVLKQKTTLTPIDIRKEYIKKKKTIIDINTGEEFKVKTFILSLFSKEVNPLVYYTAKMGITSTINYFALKGIVDLTEKVYDAELNHYFKIGKELFVECDKRYFKDVPFVQTFCYMLHDLFNTRSKISIKDDIDFWLKNLGKIFTSNPKNQLAKGKNVVDVSFHRILDETTKGNLRWNHVHTQSTHSMIRYMMTNYTELRQKDNHDLKYKRVRNNELIAQYAIKKMAKRVNTLLNKSNLTIQAIEKIFNFNEDELFRSLIFGKSPCKLIRYGADLNDFTALNALRITSVGLQGLSGGRNVSVAHRDIYPSHVGRLDPNAISHKLNCGFKEEILYRKIA